MNVTEDEANTKWCPFIRWPSTSDPGNRPVNNKHFCLGSGCMIWLWKDGKHEVGTCGLISK